ncbi:MAG: ferrous iron transport protein A [bacterium]|nr:ferrous iron transport protein A [bacterium]
MLPRSAVATAAVGERLTLNEADRGAVVKVVRVSGRPRLIQRLAALGVVPGAQLSVVKAHGPAIVSMGGARIAIGRSAAESVEIEVTDG